MRSDDDAVELLSDAVGSRTLWYAIDRGRLLVATTQRAIVRRLGSFDCAPEAASWMLLTGTPGPRRSWDQRIRMLPPACTLRVARPDGRTTQTSHERTFRPERLSDAALVDRFEQTLRSVFDRLDYADRRWMLPLSGGWDSRGLLFLLRPDARPRTYTHTAPGTETVSTGDAALAKRLAARAGVSNRLFPMAVAEDLSAAEILARFVRHSDGRIDHIAGFVDGFAVDAALRDDGVEAIIRGEEGFGKRLVASDRDARLNVGLPRPDDYANFPALLRLGLTPPSGPDWADRDGGETREQYRDRLCHQWRLPVVLASLASTHAAFVDVVSPLVFGDIVDFVHTLPDHLRTGKRAFRRVVRRLGTDDIPIATTGAAPDLRAFLSGDGFAAAVRERLADTPDLFPEPVAATILTAAQTHRAEAAGAPSLSRRLRRGISRTDAGKRLLGVVKTHVRPPTLPPHTLLLRMAIALETVAQFRAVAGERGT